MEEINEIENDTITDDGIQEINVPQEENAIKEDDATRYEVFTQQEDATQQNNIIQQEDGTQQEHADSGDVNNGETEDMEVTQQSENQEKVSEEGDTHEDLEEVEKEHTKGEHEEDEKVYKEDKQEISAEGDEILSEQVEREQLEDKQEETIAKEETMTKEEQKPPDEVLVEEENLYVEEPPPDPTAPFDFSDSKEALKEPFELRPEQLAEVEQLWELYQNYTPAYTDIDGYITEKELVYMLKSLFVMTFTPEQLKELIAYCVRPPHPEGHIKFEQFLKMVTIRQRVFDIEDELRSALQVFDPDRTGSMDREFLKEVLAKQGCRMPQKQLDNLIKEVDLSNDGTIGVEDVIGTMCIDLNKEDLILLRAAIFPPDELPSQAEDI